MRKRSAGRLNMQVYHWCWCFVKSRTTDYQEQVCESVFSLLPIFQPLSAPYPQQSQLTHPQIRYVGGIVAKFSVQQRLRARHIAAELRVHHVGNRVVLCNSAGRGGREVVDVGSTKNKESEEEDRAGNELKSICVHEKRSLRSS